MSYGSTQVTVVGRVVTDIRTRVTPSGDKVASFRIACQERRYDKAQDLWVDGDRMYMSVSCWRNVADHVEASLSQGDQVIAMGHLKLHEYTSKEGERRTDMEVNARSIGPDLALHTAMVTRPNWPVSPNQQSLLPTEPQPPDRSPDEPAPREEVPQAA
jgi:single-strand DNA-binding protein